MPEIGASTAQTTSENHRFWNRKWEKGGHYSQAEVTSQPTDWVERAGPLACQTLGWKCARNISPCVSALGEGAWLVLWLLGRTLHWADWDVTFARRLFARYAGRCSSIVCYGAISNAYNWLTMHFIALPVVSQWLWQYLVHIQDKFVKGKISVQFAFFGELHRLHSENHNLWIWIFSYLRL